MSSSAVSTVAIAGITGKLGQLIAKSVLSYPEANIRGFCRDQSKLSKDIASNPRVSILQGSSDDIDTAREAIKGSEVVICAYLGPNDFMVKSQKVLIDAAVAEKVPRYIASDWALDFTKLKLGDLPRKDPMIEIKAYLETKSIKGVHILNGAFMPLFQMAFSQDHVGYWGTGNEKWDVTSYDTCADYTAAIAMDPSASGVIKGKPSAKRKVCVKVLMHLQVLGDRVSFKEAAKIFAKHTGQEPNMKQLGTQEELRRKIDEAREKGQTDWPHALLYVVGCETRWIRG